MNVKSSEKQPELQIPIVDKSKLINMSADAKENYVKELKISYPKMLQAFSVLEDCKRSWKSAEPECGYIFGETRVGKSTVAKEVLRKYPEVMTEDSVIKPVFYTSVPSSAHIGPLVAKVLYDLKDPFWNKNYRNYTVPTMRLYDLLKACQVELIIVDEVQQIVDRDRKKLIMESADWFKDLFNMTNIPIVFLGLPEASKIFDENKQLAGRVLNRVTLEDFKDDKSFRQFLYIFDTQLPFRDMSGLANKGTWESIYIATGGRMGYMKSLLTKATKIAAEHGQQAINLPILAHAYNAVLHHRGLNPFLSGFDFKNQCKD